MQVSDNLAEKLTNNFYLWERRGRGWQVWDVSVELEPPFVPFFYQSYREPIPLDDGQQPTFLSAIADTINSIFGDEPQTAEQSVSPPETVDAVLPNPFENTEEIIELKISLPSNYKVNTEYMHQCLISLTFGTLPVSFEIIGSVDKTELQIACRRSDVVQIKNQIQAYFPESTITQNNNSLQYLQDNNKETVIVDFGLSEEFMRPLQTVSSFDPDPFIRVFGTLENLEKDELGIVQILFQSVINPWADSIMRSVTDNKGDSFFADAPEMTTLARKKVQDPLFAVVIRIVGHSSTNKRAWEIARSLAGCLSVFTDPQSNELIPLNNTNYDESMHIQDVILRRTHRSGMILNSSELISLVHFPSASVVSAKLRGKAEKSYEAPLAVQNNQFVFGDNIHNGKKTIVSVNHEQRLRHMHVIGATGTGKSTLLLNLIQQDIAQGGGIAVFDPHGDLIDAVLERIPEIRYEDVVIFDPGDEAFPIGFNILEAKSYIEKNVLSSDLVEIFRRFSTSWGDQMSVVLGNAISAFLESTLPGSLIELRRFLIEKEFRNDFLQNVNDTHVKYFWEKEFPLLKGSALSSILTRLDFFLRPKLVRNIVSQKKGIDVGDIVSHKKILLVKLAQGIIGDENAFLLGSLLVSKLHQVAMQRQLQSSNEREPFYLYIDEFQNFITPSMKSILSGARKYHLGLILSHQDLHQIVTTDSGLSNALISNAGIRVCFRIGDFDAQKLESGFAHFNVSDMQNLSTGEALVRIQRSDWDFNLKTNVPTKVETQIAQRSRESIIERSRKKYGKRISEEIPVKQEIQNIRVQPKQKELNELIDEPIYKDGTPKIDVTQLEQKNVSYHRYLQSLIKRMAEQQGFKATIEEQVLDGKGRVDVGLMRGTEKIACEISVTTNDEHEIKNIEKCFQAGYNKVLFCSAETKRLESLRSLVNKKLSSKYIDKVLFILPDDLFLFFEQETLRDMVQEPEKLVKGYRVKIEYNDISEAEKIQKRKAIGGVILQSLRKLKQE
jgi:hypothetical protein